MANNNSWKEEAWEEFLKKYWDTRSKDINSVLYTTKDLESILSKYTKSGQGEIRVFHYGNEKINAVKKRGVTKIPVTRNSWKIVKKPKQLNFTEPSSGGVFIPKSKLTDGMIAGVIDTLNTKTNPGETTLLAIANHAGIISDFYNLKEHGILFTGGRQKAGISLMINNERIDMTKAQIEIDGGFEWPNFVVIVEMKSSFNQKDFDINQAMFPFFKWKNILKNKIVKSLVLLAETNPLGIEYRAYDIEDISDDNGINALIKKSKKYIISVL